MVPYAPDLPDETNQDRSPSLRLFPFNARAIAVV